MDNIILGKLKSIIQEIRLIPDHQFEFKRLIKRPISTCHITIGQSTRHVEVTENVISHFSSGFFTINNVQLIDL